MRGHYRGDVNGATLDGPHPLRDNAPMPLVVLYPSANASLPEDPSALLAGLSRLMAEQTGKSERWVMTRMAAPRPMTFGGSGEPCCYVECKSIGLDAALATKLSAALTPRIAEGLGVSPERIYIELAAPPGALWGFGGDTLG